jgi:hypothetical protein
MTIEERLKEENAEALYWYATGTFLKMLNKCTKVADIRKAINEHVDKVNKFRKEFNVYHVNDFTNDKKESLLKEFNTLKEGPVITKNAIKIKDVFPLIPEHRIGGLTLDANKDLHFINFNKSTGVCENNKGVKFEFNKCLLLESSKLVYEKSKKKCNEYKEISPRKKELLREVPLMSCSVAGAPTDAVVPPTLTPTPTPTPTPVVAQPTPTPTPVVAQPTPTPATPTVVDNSPRGQILQELDYWKNLSLRSPSSINRDLMKQATKTAVIKLADYDALNRHILRYPNLMPSGIRDSKILAIWDHLDKNIYRWAARKTEIEMDIRKQMAQSFGSKKDVEKIGKPLFKELAHLNMKLVLKENDKFGISPSTIRYPAGSVGDMWKELNEHYYKKKWHKMKSLFYSHEGF